MSSDAVAIQAVGLGKCYDIFDNPADRLRQPVINRLRGIFGLSPRQYGRTHWALKETSFEIRRGETLGIIGRNGSGKSSLLQMICGVLQPTIGEVMVNGRVAALLELGAGFNPAFTGRENVLMNGTILGLTRSEILDRFERIAEFAEIGEFIDQPVSTYSSGMYVRLAFSVMAHVDADILVIDEALAVGDIFFTQKCMRFLRQFQERGTVLFVSHDSAAVVNLCDRAIWLDRGELRDIGSAQLICERYLASQYNTQAKAAVATVPQSLAQEASKTRQQPTPPEIPYARPEYDMRRQFVNDSQLRNDIEVFRFTGPDRHFGSGGATVVDTYLANENDHLLTWVVGGERVEMVVMIRAEQRINRLIVGFFFKDRLGQVLFGDNTYLTYFADPVSADVDDLLEARFAFQMPILPRGAYTVDVAVADGTHDDHVQLQWVHDAFSVESHSSSASTGLIGIPFGKIQLHPLAKPQA
jgi:lipopolysaccharide transport system ATP-binding protein